MDTGTNYGRVYENEKDPCSHLVEEEGIALTNNVKGIALLSMTKGGVEGGCERAEAILVSISLPMAMVLLNVPISAFSIPLMRGAQQMLCRRVRRG
jgi:hypothetical protein